MSDLGTFTPDNLFAGHVQPVVVGAETVTGGSFKRGTALGYITASGKVTLLAKEAADPATGAEKLYAILADDVDASEEDKVATVYYTGEFNARSVIFDEDDSAEIRKVEARNIGIFFKDTVPA